MASSELDLSNGRIASTAIGACVQVPDYDFGRLMNDVRFVEARTSVMVAPPIERASVARRSTRIRIRSISSPLSVREDGTTPRPMESVADGVWVDEGPVSIVGMPLTSTMTVLRLTGGELLLSSPLPLTEDRRAAVEGLGEVAHLYAPNTFHHMWLGEWAEAYPSALVHGPAALGDKRADLAIARAPDAPGASPFDDAIAEIHIDGFRMEETVLVHQPSKTLVVTDLFHNIGTPPERWTKIYASAMGFYGRVALSRMLRWTAFRDRGAARRSVDAILAQPFERVVVGHGAPILRDAKSAVTEATRWLPVATPVERRLSRGEGSAIVSRRPCG